MLWICETFLLHGTQVEIFGNATRLKFCSQHKVYRVYHSTILTFAPGRSNSLKQKEVETSGISWSACLLCSTAGDPRVHIQPHCTGKGANSQQSLLNIGLGEGRHSTWCLRHCTKTEKVIVKTIILFWWNSEIKTPLSLWKYNKNHFLLKFYY